MEKLKKESDEELLKRLAQDETQALEVLYFRHSKKVYNYALKRGLSRDLSEELVQTVFWKLFTLRERYDSKYLGLQWIYVITKSETKDLRQKEYRKNKALSDFKESLSQNLDSHPNTSIEDVYSSDAYKRLNESQKSVVNMRVAEDKSFDEIAEALKMNPSNVRQLYSRAVKSLKSYFSK